MSVRTRPLNYRPAHDRKLTALVDGVTSAISAVSRLAAREYNQSFRRTDNEGVTACLDCQRASDVADQQELAAAADADIAVSRADLDARA